jgi:hypothetical protein
MPGGGPAEGYDEPVPGGGPIPVPCYTPVLTYPVFIPTYVGCSSLLWGSFYGMGYPYGGIF